MGEHVETKKLIITRVGKAGITNGIVEEIKKQLKRTKVVKVKFLSAFIKGKDKKEVVKELAENVGASIKQRVGFTAVLQKK